jgi:hypothetical protein
MNVSNVEWLLKTAREWLRLGCKEDAYLEYARFQLADSSRTEGLAGRLIGKSAGGMSKNVFVRLAQNKAWVDRACGRQLGLGTDQQWRICAARF